MANQNLEITFIVDGSPDDVFAAINDVRAWWSGEISGDTDRLGGEFTYTYEDIHRSTQLITEFVPAKRVAWHVTDAYLNFIEDAAEWVGTDILFDIEPADGGTRVRFTHVGLTPSVECWEACSPAWNFYAGESLRNLIIANTANGHISREQEGARA